MADEPSGRGKGVGGRARGVGGSGLGWKRYGRGREHKMTRPAKLGSASFVSLRSPEFVLIGSLALWLPSLRRMKVDGFQGFTEESSAEMVEIFAS